MYIECTTWMSECRQLTHFDFFPGFRKKKGTTNLPQSIAPGNQAPASSRRARSGLEVPRNGKQESVRK